jgi:hypothetical protein
VIVFKIEERSDYKSKYTKACDAVSNVHRLCPNLGLFISEAPMRDEPTKGKRDETTLLGAGRAPSQSCRKKKD